MRWQSKEIGSFSNDDDDDAEDNGNLYFTWESRNNPDVFIVSIGLRTSSRWVGKSERDVLVAVVVC